MSQFGAYMVDKNQKNVLPTSKFRAEKVVKMITDLYKADDAPRDHWVGSGNKYASPTDIFLAEATPIFFSGNWQVASFAKNAKFDFAAVPNPKELNGGGWPGGKFLVAFNASKTPDLAAYFLHYLADAAQVEQMAKAAFWLPARADLVAKGIKYPTRGDDMNVFATDAGRTPAAAYGIQSVPTLTGKIYDKLRDSMTEVIGGKITAKQAIAIQIAWIDEQLATLKK
jgi:alpha-1,4-digalacturonate transport system substrate-binding protein